MKGSVELMIHLLLLLWMHSLVANCRPISPEPISCSLARNYVEYGPNGDIIHCRPCPECGEEQGLLIPCGSKITNDSEIKCVSCRLNKTYSDSHGIGSCKVCQYCGLRNVVQPCTLSQNRKCGDKCPRGYYFNQDFNDCLQVISAQTTRSKPTELTPTVHQNPNHSRTTKKHLKTEPSENITAVSPHYVQTTPSSIQIQFSSSVVNGTKPTASPVKTTQASPLLTENGDTTSVLPTAKVQHQGENDSILSTIIIILLVVAIRLLFALVIMCHRARKESTNTEPELRDSAEEIPLNSIDTNEDSSDGTMSSFTTQDDLTDHLTLDEVKELMTPADNLAKGVTDHASSDKSKDLVTPPDFSADNEVSVDEAVDELNLLNFPADLPVSCMEELCYDSRGNLFCFVQKKLDAVETLTTKTWRSIGRTLKLSADDLNLIEADFRAGLSPTESLFTKLKTSEKEPTLQEFVQALKNCQRYDIANYIYKWPWGKLVEIQEGQDNDQSVTNQSQTDQDNRE